MDWVWFSLLILVIIFGFVVVVGPPYVPTFQFQVEAALDLLNLKPGDTLLELGAGDGKVMVTAAERGLKVVGYELNPILVIICWFRIRRYRGRARIVWGNFLKKKWPKCEGIFTFGIDRIMPTIDKKINSLPYRPVKLASNAFKVPNKEATAERKGVFLYLYH